MNTQTLINHFYDDGSKVFFTSDTHFNHHNIIRFAHRPFADVNQMNDTIIKNWNMKVPEDATVFHLGDFAFTTPYYVRQLLTKLHGTIHLIIGNHDWKMIRDNLVNDFASVSQQVSIIVCGQRILLNHYPMLCYAGAYHTPAQWQLFGHVHSRPEYYKDLEHNTDGLDIPRLTMLMPTQYDVGVDNNGYAPISFPELKQIIEKQIHEYNERKNTKVAS